jgi:carboxylesterase type B
MLLPFLILGTALSVAHAAPAKSETIDLGYAKYQGTTENGVDKFLGMRFADPPTGNNRFRAPQKPTSKTKDTIQATKVSS